MTDIVSTSIRIPQNLIGQKNGEMMMSVKTSAVIKFKDVNEVSTLLLRTNSTLDDVITNNNNNNSIFSEEENQYQNSKETIHLHPQSMPYEGVMENDTYKKNTPLKKIRNRNKSTGDAIDFKKFIRSSLADQTETSASVDNIYENGLYSKVIESDNETFDGNSIADISLPLYSLSKLRPKKPKRKPVTNAMKPPLNVGDEEISNYHRFMNTSLDQHNNLRVSKEDFEAFISKEKSKYSCHVSSSNVGSASENDFCSSNFLNASGNNDVKRSDGAHETKLKELGNVLDSQINHLESLLVAIPPPRTSSLRHKQSKSLEILNNDGRGLETIKEHRYESENRKPVMIKYTDVQPANVEQPKSAKSQNPVLRRVKSFKSSLSKSSKRVRSWSSVKLPSIRKSIRKSPKLHKRRPLSLKEPPSKNFESHRGYLNDDQNVKLRSTGLSLFTDNRTSKMIAKECDQMVVELELQKQIVSILLKHLITTANQSQQPTNRTLLYRKRYCYLCNILFCAVHHISL